MKQFMVLAGFLLSSSFFSCTKDEGPDNPYGNGAKTEVPPSLQGGWMYGNFSMTEYWSQNPDTYIGNAFEMAIAFKYNANGTYEHYFTSRTVSGGISTYNQSVTKGTVEINEETQTIITHAASAHYKQTKNGQTLQDRDLDETEITKNTTYSYERGVTPNGTRSVHLKINGTGNALTFLQKF